MHLCSIKYKYGSNAEQKYIKRSRPSIIRTDTQTSLEHYSRLFFHTLTIHQQSFYPEENINEVFKSDAIYSTTC